MSDEVNKHAEIIANSVWHSYPYNLMGVNFNQPHAEDCEGCLINAEVEILVSELNALKPVEKIVAELEQVKEERRLLEKDRWEAFEKAGVPDVIVEERSVTDLVATLVNDRNQLLELVRTIKADLYSIVKKVGE